MTRPLLHPLSDGSVTRTPAGTWAQVRDPDVLAGVDLREKEDRAARVRISSVPTPWARLQLPPTLRVRAPRSPNKVQRHLPRSL